MRRADFPLFCITALVILPYGPVRGGTVLPPHTARPPSRTPLPTSKPPVTLTPVTLPTLAPAPPVAVLVPIERVGPAPADPTQVIGDRYLTERGSHDYQVYIDQPSTLTVYWNFALRYRNCPVTAKGSIEVVLYTGTIVLGPGDVPQTVLKRQYSRPHIEQRASHNGLYRLQIRGWQNYVVRILSTSGCTWQFAGEPAD